eukprot:SAG31_NODE_3292_length_4454_cov_2.328588_4_plen_452_part_00
MSPGAKKQGLPGLVSENFNGPPLDRPNRAARGDDNSVVLLDVYANWLWTDGGREWLQRVWPHVKAAADWQLTWAQKYGVMDGHTNTYDEAPHMGSVNAWNAFLHVAAIKAVEALADDVGDLEFAATCAAAAARARNSTVSLLWDKARRSFRGYWCDESEFPGAVNGQPLMADALVGVLWAKILGLDLGFDDTMFVAHQDTAWKKLQSPFGLHFWADKDRDYSCAPLPGGQSKDLFTDDTIWSAHAVDEGALALLLKSVAASEALAMAERTYSLYRSHLRDQFDFRDVNVSFSPLTVVLMWCQLHLRLRLLQAVRTDGPNGTGGVRPYCNSHYTRQLLGLHAIPLGLTGQRYDAIRQTLSFTPRREVVGGMASWPLLTPHAVGLVTESLENFDHKRPKRCVSIRIFAGNLVLQSLRVDGVAYLTWLATSRTETMGTIEVNTTGTKALCAFTM